MKDFKRTKKIYMPSSHTLSLVTRKLAEILTELMTGGICGLLLVFGIILLLRYQVYYECGNSMENVLKKGSLLIVKNKKNTDYRIGDIITFTVKNRDKTICVTHRIYDKAPDGSYLTKGDANSFVDFNPVPKGNIRGVVVGQIPYYGYLCRGLKKHGMWLILFLMLRIFYMFQSCFLDKRMYISAKNKLIILVAKLKKAIIKRAATLI